MNVGPVVDVQLKSSVEDSAYSSPVRLAHSLPRNHVTVEVQHLLGGGIFRSVAMQGTQGSVVRWFHYHVLAGSMCLLLRRPPGACRWQGTSSRRTFQRSLAASLVVFTFTFVQAGLGCLFYRPYRCGYAVGNRVQGVGVRYSCRGLDLASDSRVMVRVVEAHARYPVLTWLAYPFFVVGCGTYLRRRLWDLSTVQSYRTH